MPIEFRCPQCQRLLRVGDDAVGKQAKCPACGTLAQVPNALAETAPREPRELSPPLPSGANPFGGQGTNPFNAGAFTPPPIAPPSDNPYASPFSGGESAVGTVRATKISVNGVFEDTWSIFKDNVGMLMLVHFVEWIIGQAFSNGGSVFVAILQNAGIDQMAAGLLQMAFGLSTMVLSVWLMSGRDLYFLRTAKGQSPGFSLLFAGHVVLARRLVLGLLYLLVGAAAVAPPFGIGYVVAQLSGDDTIGVVVGVAVGVVSVAVFIWIVLIYFMAWNICLDQSVGLVESLRMARAMSTGNRLSLFAVNILASLVMMAGVCACFVGVFFTMPLAYLAFIVAYMQMSGQPIAGASYVIPPRERALPAQPNF